MAPTRLANATTVAARSASTSPQTADRSPVTGYRLPVTGYRLPATGYPAVLHGLGGNFPRIETTKSRRSSRRFSTMSRSRSRLTAR